MRKSFRLRLNELQKQVHVTTVVVVPLNIFPLNWFLGRKKVEKIIQPMYRYNAGKNIFHSVICTQTFIDYKIKVEFKACKTFYIIDKTKYHKQLGHLINFGGTYFNIIIKAANKSYNFVQ